MMKLVRSLGAALVVAGALSSGCGGGPDVGITLSMSQALQADVTAVEIRILGSAWTCPTLKIKADEVVQLPLCANDRWDLDPPCIIKSTRQDLAAVPVELFVPPGERQIFVSGLNAEGERIAVGCVGPVDITANATVEVRVPLS